MSVSRIAIVVALSTASSVIGCAVPADDADRFREPIPLEEEVALRVPKGDGVRSTSQGLHVTTEGTAAAPARYYQLTRDLTSAVDFGTAVILGGIWTIVNSPPTTLEPKKAVWGPGSANALEPAVWRFTVTEVGAAEYDYVLEGQPRAGGAFRTV